LIRKHGVDGFYGGKTGAAIVKASRAGGGIIGQEDLNRYKTRELPPIECDYRGYHVISAPPPSSGGVAICEMLNILEEYPLQGLGWGSAQAVHYEIEAMRHAYADRSSLLGDPDFVGVPVERLTSKVSSLRPGFDSEASYGPMTLPSQPETVAKHVADALALGEGAEIGAPDVIATAWCERSLLAVARGDWSSAEAFAAQAGLVMRGAGIEDMLVCAVQARVALHGGDVTAARRELVNAQRLRPFLTYVQPHLAVQARLELARVQFALADMAGARTLMREIDEILKRRPDLGTLVGEARVLRARLSAEHAPAAPGASSLTAAELRVLPMLATHLSFPEIGADMFLSPHTVKSQAMSIYRKLGASSRNQAVTRSRELGLFEG
jgi:DNA-binding CsgD family transcriptional regulator